MARHLWAPVYYRALLTVLLASSGLSGAVLQPPQEERQDTTRGLWDKRFAAARNKAKRGPGRGSRQKQPGVDEFVGVTIWRLRNVTEGDAADKPRLLEQKGGKGPNELLAERVRANTLFSEGQLVRIGIEVPRDGYLYVIDRELRADRSMSDPYLIFPTRRTRDGDNTVFAGKLIEIPAQTDNPPYFTLRRNRSDQVSENLTIIVSPRRLPLPFGDKAVKVDPAQVSRWERDWGGKTEWREATSGAYKDWTVAEKEAAVGKRQLVQDDPLPQTIYRVEARPGTPLLVTVSLRIAP